jgi:L-ascorbate metabolism protein UlaG (beta-lactamase superfamily)
MDITWLGHAGFRIRSGNTALLMDPFSSDLGLNIPPQHAQANVLTISGHDPLHSTPPNTGGESSPFVIDGPGEYEAAGFRIKGVRTSRYAEPDAGPEWNTIYIVDIEGILLCHLGNPSQLLTTKQIEELASPHVLLLPVGSPTGLSSADAVELVNAISPKIVVPMLYAHAGNKADLRELAPFLQELGVKEPASQARLTVTRGALPEEAQVETLKPAGVLL